MNSDKRRPSRPSLNTGHGVEVRIKAVGNVASTQVKEPEIFEGNASSVLGDPPYFQSNRGWLDV